MKWVCIVANFFLPGLGYLIGVPEKRVYAPLFLVGVCGLTYVEQMSGLEAALPTAFKVMFASVLIMNTGFAVDTFMYFKNKPA
jgi:hypothetical protein